MKLLIHSSSALFLSVVLVVVVHPFDLMQTALHPFGFDIEKTMQTVSGINPIRALWKNVLGVDNVTIDPEEGIPLPFPTTLTTPSFQEAEHYVHYAAAAYCEGSPLSSYTCKECRVTGPTVRMLQVLKNSSAETQGFIALDPSKQEIVVVFRGTHNVQNWMHDLTWDLVPSPLGDGSLLHTGFVQSTMSLYPQVLSIIRNVVTKYPGYRVVVTGHSLGAAMSTLTYYFLSHDLPTLDYAVFTQGEPRVGNRAFADIINARSIPLARVVNEGDVVAHLAVASAGFVHHQTEYWTHKGVTRICSRDVYEDPTCSNSLGKTNEQVIGDHLMYMGVNIGLNCLEENPIAGVWTMLSG